MTLTFAWCDIPGYEYDAPGAILKNFMNVFQMDASDLSPVSNIDAKRFEVELLDGQKWMLPRKHRLQQSFTTQPNLLLFSQSLAIASWDAVNRKAVTNSLADYSIQDLITKWFYGRSQWIVTPDIADATEKKYGLVKVIPKSDKVNDKHEQIGIMPSTTIQFETCGVYAN